MGVSLFFGCRPSEKAPRVAKPNPLGTVSIRETAQRLGLSIERTDYPYIELTGPNNRVLLFMYERGRVYVNGAAVAPVGKMLEIGEQYYIAETLIPKIRAAMLPETAYIPQVIPTPPSLPQPGAKSGIIVVDAGHGGQDPGTTSVLGTQEKTINLKIAHRLADFLRQAGYQVVMTREGDSSITKEERAALSNRVNADFFVAVHCDSNENGRHAGFTVYVARQASWSSTKVARQVENSLSNSGIPSKGVRNADYVVLVQTRCPAVLVECGFLSNYDDANKLLDPWYQGKVAGAIADAIIRSI